MGHGSLISSDEGRQQAAPGRALPRESDRLLYSFFHVQNILGNDNTMDWFGFLGASGFGESNLIIICST